MLQPSKRTLAVLFAVTLVAFRPLLGGERAPNFRYRTIDGDQIELRKLLKRGPVLINFWALWCVPCQRELPYLDRIGRAHEEQGLTVLAVSEDGEQANSRVRSYVKGRGFRFRVIVDKNKELFRLYRVSVLPTSFLVDTNGQLVYQHVGYRPGDEKVLEREIEKLLVRNPHEEQ